MGQPASGELSMARGEEPAVEREEVPEARKMMRGVGEERRRGMKVVVRR